MTKLISIVTPCYNEEENVELLYQRVKEVISSLPDYRYAHIFIDNHSSDGTVPILKRLAANDPNVKIIVNARNFGHIRSPHHAILQTKGEAVISMVADFQDPPELIAAFIKKWEEGFKMILGNIIAIVNAYVFHKYVTFKSPVKGKGIVLEFTRFCMTYLVTFCVSLVLLPLFVEAGGIDPKLAGGVVILLCTAISYLGHSRFSFKRGPAC